MNKTMKFIFLILIFILPTAWILAEQADPYKDYLNRLDNIKTEQDIEKNGFTAIKKQAFFVEFEHMGNVNFIPAIDEKYGRILLLFFDSSGYIAFKTDQIESNNWNKGEMIQPNRDIEAVAFRDLNHDGLKDVAIVCSCRNQTGMYAGEPYRIAEVLFQTSDGFYRDWRISDRMNRFSMNVDIPMVTSFVRDGQSVEFLYTSNTMDQLLEKGFQVIEGKCFTAQLEKFGEVQVRPGVFVMAGQYIFMVFLINSNREIVWNFEPMNGYATLHELNALSFQDVNGDGLKDMVIQASYGRQDEKGITALESDVSIYHQGAGYFYEDLEFKRTLSDVKLETIRSITEKARKFWEGRNEK